MKEIEIWKDIPGYEELYQVSNFGRVKSLYFSKEKILKQIKNTDGYLVVNLWKDGKQKNFRVHQLVALVYIVNTENYPIINHKDENKENNHVNNLEWCTYLYNNNYGSRNERLSEAMKGKQFSEDVKQKIGEAHKKPILQYTKESEFIREWDSAKSASIELNITRENIIKCCKGERNKCGGFIWKYKE